MNTSTYNPAFVPLDVSVDDEMIRVKFQSGLELATPVAQFPRLQRATPEQRKVWRLIGKGDGICWPDTDEDISVRGLFTASRAMPASEPDQIMTAPHSFENGWDALCDTREEAANLKARSRLMSQIQQIVKHSSWTQIEAAKHCGVTLPRMGDLLEGHIYRFSLDSLISIATALGRKVRVEIEAA